MMLGKGRAGDEQILSRSSIELMTADQLTPAQRAGCDIFFGAYGSWGLGLGVDIARDEIFHNPGRFGWDGGFGTSAYTDPAEDHRHPADTAHDRFTRTAVALHGLLDVDVRSDSLDGAAVTHLGRFASIAGKRCRQGHQCQKRAHWSGRPQ
jgi:hypothetical protein